MSGLASAAGVGSLRGYLIEAEYTEAIVRVKKQIQEMGPDLKTQVDKIFREALIGLDEKSTTSGKAKSAKDFKSEFREKARQQDRLVSDQVQKITDLLDKYRVEFSEEFAKEKEAVEKAIEGGCSREKSAPKRAAEEKGEEIPEYIKNFDITQPHTINFRNYYDIRVSEVIQNLIKIYKIKTEIFIGCNKEMIAFYDKHGLTKVAHLKTRGSVNYFVFGNLDGSDDRLVISGIGNHSKFCHILLQLKLSGIDLETLNIRRTIEDAIKENLSILRTKIGELPANPGSRLAVFLGNRAQILIGFAKKIYSEEMREFTEGKSTERQEKIAEQLLLRNKLETHDIEGVYKFSHFVWSLHGKKIGIIGFRMPNGSLAHYAMKALMERGISHLILVGAGGSFDGVATPVGSYQLIKQAFYNEQTIQRLPIVLMDLNLNRLDGTEKEVNRTVNETVDSPLVETIQWMENIKEKKVNSVDVETYHIFSGIQQANRGGNVKVIPGIFTSDVVGVHSLEDKIDPANAWAFLPELIYRCYEYLFKELR